MGKLWKIKASGNEDIINGLSKKLGIHKVLANLLVQRGVNSFEQAKSFFRPKLSDLYDPYLMEDMDRAISRLLDAMERGEKILIYGDYDVDGTTSVALVFLFLSRIYDQLDYYVPDRYSEGYGISYSGIDYAKENDVKLIIALDCGIKAIEKVEYAKSLGIDFIICDHHTPDEEIPKAAAVLDPKRKDCSYPFKELSGCGVGFKLMQAVCMEMVIPQDELHPYLDLVVVSIASDIVPIIDENRVLAYFGLKFLNTSPHFGLRAILEVSGCMGKVLKIEDIVFKIGPRINAAGRMESGRQAVELLLSDDEKTAHERAKRVDNHNKQRRDIDHDITEEALNIIANDKSMIDQKTTVLFNNSWHKGVVGIVASRLIEKYYRPTIILTESNGFATGSARSVADYDLYSAISACSDLLESFGGHMFAAGLTLKTDNVPLFKTRFEKYVNETIRPDQLIPQVEIDSEIQLSDIMPKFYRILKQFEPFGPGNMNPVFFTENVADDGSGRLVGVTKDHIKLSLIQENNPFQPYPAIAFNQSQKFDSIKQGKFFDIAYNIVENEFMGKTSLQLNIKDIKVD